jgi:hypothetical protein
MCLIDVAKFIVRVLFEIEYIRRFLAIACNQMCNSKQLIINYKKINYICYTIFDTTCLGAQVHIKNLWFMNQEESEDIPKGTVNRRGEQGVNMSKSPLTSHSFYLCRINNCHL